MIKAALLCTGSAAIHNILHYELRIKKPNISNVKNVSRWIVKSRTI